MESTMITTRKAAPMVHLNKDWQEKYTSRSQELLASLTVQPQIFTICIVGRSGVGKGSLINHLLGQRIARVARTASNYRDEEKLYDIHGLRVREIPGYDGRHTLKPKPKSSFLPSASFGNSNGRMELVDFVRAYGLFEEETNAIIFVVNNRITPQDYKLISLAVESHKFFFIVCTHGDGIARVTDCKLQTERLEENEEEIRGELGLAMELNVRLFVVSIPWPESKEMGIKLDGSDLADVSRNRKSLHFPLLHAYIAKPEGLQNELQIHKFVREEVWKLLGPSQTVKKRYQSVELSEHIVVGTLLPIAGPTIVSFTKTLYYTLKACKEVGLIKDPDNAIQRVNDETNKRLLATQITSNEAMVTSVHEILSHIFGKVVFEMGLAEVVSVAAEATFSEVVPLVGTLISSMYLPSRYRKIADRLLATACMLHGLWIIHNITGLLDDTSPKSQNQTLKR